ncbi:unnamed protein product, partial [Effrenium voratum]
VYGFAWFEAHLCKGGICPSVTPGPCQVVEDYHGVQGQDGLQKWRMVRFSAEDNVEEQHIFAVAKLLYFLRKWGIEKKDPKCISEGSEEQIAFTMEDGTNFEQYPECDSPKRTVCQSVCKFWAQVYTAATMHSRSTIPRLTDLFQKAKRRMAGLLFEHQQRFQQMNPGLEVPVQLWEEDVLTRNSLYVEFLEKAYAEDQKLRTRPDANESELREGCERVQNLASHGLAFGMETYWTQGSFDAVVGRLQLGLQKPCGELGARGDFCQLRLRQTSYFDALVENLADLWKEQAHFVQGSSKAHKQIESLLKVELGDGAMQRICQDKHVCQALRRAAEKPE